jgi:hypothetical protein
MSSPSDSGNSIISDLSSNNTINATNESTNIVNNTNNTNITNIRDISNNSLITNNQEELNKTCVGNKLETQECIDYCNLINVNCDRKLKDYCINSIINVNVNPSSKLCDCFKPDDFYNNVKKSISQKYDAKFTNENNYCYFKNCRNAIVKPFKFKTNNAICENGDGSCFSFVETDISGNLSGVSITQSCNINNKDQGTTTNTTKSSSGVWPSILLSLFLIVLFVGYYIFKKKKNSNSQIQELNQIQ